MDLSKVRNFVLLSMPLFFGWLLAFPYYGPVYNSAVPDSLKDSPLFLLFVVVHGMTYLLGSLIIKKTKACLKMMLVSIIAIIVTSAILFLPFDILWFPAMVVFGFFSSLYVLGWCCFYSLFVPNNGRLRLMAAVIILANVIFVVFNLLASFLYAQIVMALALLPLIGAGMVLFCFEFPYLQTSKEINKRVPVSRPFLAIICLFVFALYLNGGLMFKIILPSLDAQVPFAFYYRFVLYILVLMIMYVYGEQLQRYFPIYMAVALLGLAFVSFALLSELIAGFILTVGLLEAAFAMLDLFLWVLLGSLAYLYKAPFKFFGLALAANLGGIFLGDFFGDILLHSGESIRLITAIFASLSIFIVFLVVPWLSRQIDERLPKILEGNILQYSLPGGALEKLEAYLMHGEKLTPREIEITTLIIKGYTNTDIARKLFVSPNTVKTHLKNIFKKFGISKKKELIKLYAIDE